MESGAHCNLDYMDCVDMLGVTDHAFVNEHEIAVERIESIKSSWICILLLVVSLTACVVAFLSLNQIIDEIK